MANACPAMLLPQEAFEVIISHLNLAELCAVESTCKAWRELGLLCAPAPALADSSPLKGRLDREERIDSFGFWLHKRGSRLQRLKHEHLDCQRHNSIAFNAFDTVSTTLTSLYLIVSKYTKNRRGIPEPATFSWLPIFPNLTSLFLDIRWSVSLNWELTRWAPNLKELSIRAPSRAPQGIALDISRAFVTLGRSENILPKTIEVFKACGELNGLQQPIRYALWVPNLTSLSLGYPMGVDEKDGQTLMRHNDNASGPVIFDLNLVNLRALREVELGVSLVGAGLWVLYQQRYDALAAMTKLVRLKTLKWAHTDFGKEFEAGERSANIEMMKFLNLERLHILGQFTGWQQAAGQGAFSQVKELVVVGGGSEAYLPKGPCLPNLEHLVVDFTIIKTSIYLAEESSQLDERKNGHKATNACEFAPYLRNLKKVTVLTSGFPAIWNITDITIWLRNLLRHTGNSVAIDIEGEEYLSFVKSCFACEGIQVGAADVEMAKSAEVWKSWEMYERDQALLHYDEFGEEY